MFILIFFVLFQLILTKEKPLATLKITDNYYIIKQFEMEIYDKYLPSDKLIDINKSGKVIYVSSIDRFLEIVDKYEGYYNSRWILLIDKFDVMDSITKYIITNIPNDVYALILDIRLSSESYNIQNIPIFIAEEDDFHTLQEYDVVSETSNIFIRIAYTNSNKIFPENYLFILSITLAIVILFTTVYWHILMKFHSNQISHLQKILSSLPYIKLFLSPMIIYYIKYANKSDTDASALLVTVYLDTIISALWAIYKTLFWFLAILVSSGWQIHKTELTRIETRQFVAIYIIIYFFLCFDKIIDIMVGRTFWRFETSELKNFLLYCFLSGYCIYKASQSIKFLKSKFLYASILAPEYLPALALKIKMLFFFSILIPVYTICYIAMVVVQKYMFFDFSDDTGIFSMVHNHGLEIIFLLMVLPRRFPRFFNIEYHIEEYGKTSIFNCKLPSLEKIANANSSSTDFGFLNMSTKEKKKFAFDQNTPFIIVNPIFKDDVRRSHVVINRSDSIDSGSPFNFTDKISLGFLS